MENGVVNPDIVLFVLGTVIGFFINYYFSKKGQTENEKYFETRFGPQVLNILIGETSSIYKKHSSKSSDAKEVIGSYVASRWGIEGSTILLDAGTTTERVARYLSSSDVNDMLICTANPIAGLHFMSRSKSKCFLFPGEIDENYAGTISTQDFISSVISFAESTTKDNNNNSISDRYRIGIIGALPISHLIGPCSNDERTIHIKKTILDLSNEIVVVVDFSKFEENEKYTTKYYPVYDNQNEWIKILKGDNNYGKKITIVTYLSKKNDESINCIRKLNNQYYASVHCVYGENC